MKQQSPKTIRLLMPQWQGGNNAAYPLGARLLEWLAPKSDEVTLEVPVERFEKVSTEKEAGIIWRRTLLKQLRAARNLIDAHVPDRVVVFGGDCLVDQASFAYLNERYDGRLGVLWVDAHPDVLTPNEFYHAHTMVLGNLLGEGDEEFAREVRFPIDPKRVMFAGLNGTTEKEAEVIGRLGMRTAGPGDLAESSAPVLDWIAQNEIEHLAIHLDLDVLDPKLFRSLLFANPQPDPNTFVDFPMGEMTFEQVGRLVREVSAATEVVGLGITEHMPWEAINLKAMLEQFPILTNG